MEMEIDSSKSKEQNEIKKPEVKQEVESGLSGAELDSQNAVNEIEPSQTREDEVASGLATQLDAESLNKFTGEMWGDYSKGVEDSVKDGSLSEDFGSSLLSDESKSQFFSDFKNSLNAPANEAAIDAWNERVMDVHYKTQSGSISPSEAEAQTDVNAFAKDYVAQNPDFAKQPSLNERSAAFMDNKAGEVEAMKESISNDRDRPMVGPNPKSLQESQAEKIAEAKGTQSGGLDYQPSEAYKDAQSENANQWDKARENAQSIKDGRDSQNQPERQQESMAGKALEGIGKVGEKAAEALGDAMSKTADGVANSMKSLNSQHMNLVEYTIAATATAAAAVAGGTIMHGGAALGKVAGAALGSAADGLAELAKQAAPTAAEMASKAGSAMGKVADEVFFKNYEDPQKQSQAHSTMDADRMVGSPVPTQEYPKELQNGDRQQAQQQQRQEEATQGRPMVGSNPKSLQESQAEKVAAMKDSGSEKAEPKSLRETMIAEAKASLAASGKEPPKRERSAGNELG